MKAAAPARPGAGAARRLQRRHQLPAGPRIRGAIDDEVLTVDATEPVYDDSHTPRADFFTLAD